MNLRDIYGLTIGAVGVALFVSSNAMGAVTVLGPGPAVDCYNAAEFGTSANEAIPVCTFALAGPLSKSDRAATYVNRGVLHMNLMQNDKALADINAGIAINPELGDGYVDRGAALITLKHYDEALADLDKGISLGAHRVHIAYYDRAIVHEILGDVRDAYYDYKKALEIEPTFTRASEELKRFKVTQKPGGV